MTWDTLTIAVAEAAVFLLVAVSLGERVLGWCERFVAWAAGGQPIVDQTACVTRLGAALLVGFGVTGYIGVVVGLARVFAWPVLLAVGILAIVSGRRAFLSYTSAGVCWIRGQLDPFPRRYRMRQTLVALGALLIVVLFVSAFQAALSPPRTSDELSYHMPQVKELVSTQTLPLTIGGHYFYGNIPKLMEVLYGEALAVGGGYPLAHLLHLMIAGSFLVFAFGMLRSYFGLESAVLAVLLLLLYFEFAWNATTGLVDSASASFEIAGLLAFTSWLVRRHPEDVARSAVFFAFALSVKYTAGPTVAFASVILLAVLAFDGSRRREIARMAGALAVIVVVGCGFWYGKNLVRFGNPVYPLYFGHRGVSDARYSGLVENIHQFGPRTLHEFVRVPNRFANYGDILVYLSFFLASFSLLVRRSAVIVWVMFAFFAMYVAYWFFVASHQARFLMSALIVSQILLAITVFHVRSAVARGLMVAVTAVALASVNPSLADNARANLVAAVKEKLRWENWRYSLGLDSENDYLRRYFGCHISALIYLDRHNSTGNVIDNWSMWYDFPVVLYERDNHFRGFPSPARGELLRQRLQRRDFRFLYIRTTMKDIFRNSADWQTIRYRDARLEAEAEILQHSKPIWSEDECRLYRVVW